MAVDPDHLLVRDEGVDYGLLGGLHRGLVEGVKAGPCNDHPRSRCWDSVFSPQAPALVLMYH